MMEPVSESDKKLKDFKTKYLEKSGMVQTSIYIDQATNDDLVAYSKESGEKKSTIMKIALMKFLAEMKK